MSLLVLAYPELEEKDREFIQSFREEHDELYYKIVEPHFTIVFPVHDMEKSEFITEIDRMSHSFEPFDFSLRCAVINRDAFQDYWHVFLAPDEGNSDIIKLHDTLYSGSLLHNYRMDIQYVPHIGIASSQNQMKMWQLTRELNESHLEINGRVEKLSVVNFENNKVDLLKEFHRSELF